MSASKVMTPEVNRKSLSLTLGKNKLVFDNGWKVSSSDLEVAAQQINALLDGKAVLESTVASLRREVEETNKLKTVALDMLTEERCKTVALEQQLEAHKQELRESCRVILELRDQALVANPNAHHPLPPASADDE